MSIQFSTSFGMSNVIIPKGGPKCVPASADFSNVAAIEISGELIIAQGHIEFLQGVFIDNSQNSDAFNLTCGLTGQRIVAPPQSQGYYSILQPNPPIMLAETPQQNGRIIPLFFYNVPIQTQVWSVV